MEIEVEGGMRDPKCGKEILQKAEILAWVPSVQHFFAFYFKFYSCASFLLGRMFGCIASVFFLFLQTLGVCVPKTLGFMVFLCGASRNDTNGEPRFDLVGLGPFLTPGKLRS